MKTHIESINSVSKKVTVTFDGKLCEDVQNTVLKKAQAQAVISGFRKGKVPFEILKQRFGNALKSEVQQELISKALEHLKNEDKLNIVALSKAKFNELDKDQTVEMEVELQPEFELPDYKNFKLDEAKIEVPEAEVKDFIERLQKQQASYDVVDRPAKSKDYVKLSYSGTVDGRPVDDFPGIPHIWATQKTTWEEVDATDEIGIPEIVQGIKGLKAGDVKEIKVKFPKTFAVKELQQKEAIYSVEIAEVREVKLPELNEAFFKQLQVKDLEELHQFAEKTIRSRKEQEFAAQQKQKISEFLIHSVACELPSSWVHAETQKVLQEMVNLFSSHGVKNATLEEQKGALVEKAQSIARDRIKLNLCFEKIFKEEKLQLEATDIERVLVQEAAQRHIAPQKLVQMIQKDEAERSAIQGKAFQAKMINWLFDTLNKKEK